MTTSKLFSLSQYSDPNATKYHYADCTCNECEHAHVYYCGNQDCDFCNLIGADLTLHTWRIAADYVSYGELIDRIGQDGEYDVSMLLRSYWEEIDQDEDEELEEIDLDAEINKYLKLAPETNIPLLHKNSTVISALQYMSYNDAQRYLSNMFEMKSGRSRYTYIDQDHGIVYKFNSCGGEYNQAEFTNYMRYKEGLTDLGGKYIIPVAKCTLIQSNDDRFISIMEYVSGALSCEDDGFAHERDETPAWLDCIDCGSIDCYQFGYDSNGNAVMYDHSFPY